eukprot:752559-Hanusia_phi.AAC.2
MPGPGERAAARVTHWGTHPGVLCTGHVYVKSMERDRVLVEGSAMEQGRGTLGKAVGEKCSK